MTVKWLDKHTILKVIHGSHAYGTNIESSDIDYKGVCIEPEEYHYGFLNKFEQDTMAVSKGHAYDSVIYSLKKFVGLASDNNPNIIEVLFGDDSNIVVCTPFGEELLSHREAFISKKCRHTFSGYAHNQLNRIVSHRGWLLKPPKQPPTRGEFGLPETRKFSKTEMGAFEKIYEGGQTHQLSQQALEIYLKERDYNNKTREWKQYQTWLVERNPKRAELEAKFGYDTKHGQHLIRLMRMCVEILEFGKVVVKRPDFEDLLEIRAGLWEFDRLIQHAKDLDRRAAELYETSKLPHSSNKQFLNNLVVDMTSRYFQSERNHRASINVTIGAGFQPRPGTGLIKQPPKKP